MISSSVQSVSQMREERERTLLGDETCSACMGLSGSECLRLLLRRGDEWMLLEDCMVDQGEGEGV